MGQRKSDRALKKSPYDSPNQMCKKAERNACESRWDLDCHTPETETRKAEEVGAGAIHTGDGMACPHS